MNIIGENSVDIAIDENGQPVASVNGDFATVQGDGCWMQDLKCEAYSDEGELFYEDATGDEAYGFGISDFAHMENDEFTLTEIQQRISGKLEKRTYLDKAQTVQEIHFKGGVYKDKVSLAKTGDMGNQYKIELSTDEVEVET